MIRGVLVALEALIVFGLIGGWIWLCHFLVGVDLNKTKQETEESFIDQKGGMTVAEWERYMHNNNFGHACTLRDPDE